MDEQPSPLNKGEIMQSNQHTELIQAMLDQELSPPQQHMLDQFQQKNNDLASIRDDLEGLQLCFQTKWEQSAPPPSDPQAALKRLKRQLPAKPPTTHTSKPWWTTLSTLFQWNTAIAAVGIALLIPVLLNHPIQPPNPVTKPTTTQQPKTAQQPAYTHKGFPIEMLHAHRKGSTSSNQFTPARHTQNGSVLFPGDVIQFKYTFLQPTHIMIVSLNQKGEVFPFVPLNGKESIRIPAGTGTLPKRLSLILDRYTGPERFFFFGSRNSFTLQSVRGTLLGNRQPAKQLKSWKLEPEQWLFANTLFIEKQPRSASPFAAGQ